MLLDQAHAILSSLLSKDDVVVDATMGNGYDTLFLSEIAKEVYAFDIQLNAIAKTKEKVGELSHVHLIHDSHENLINYVNTFKAVIFNLGYLPQGDKEITTKTKTTLKTLNLILPILKKDGFIQLIVYPGHEEGKSEDQAIQSWIQTLNPHHYHIIETRFLHEEKHPPYMLMIYKTKDES
ncbi:MAG: hypothetical protein A2Y45_03380 [Tenericutes bacterium GWC2_34_14]|nr:MAG: hypothetical protein A2Y45_03380 [Tenericutes bacterium GWC2_34_14]OHE34346.1 MAG: hypothetical protein A2012_08970 [Tenericutes bacterium GWE2_34_108]OHE35698.1 MAG: hypothetical protein A2Y46_05735 [Tenericutes bacterium GWF1_35_14]OHE38914.1 MAG: hypothetical protein A2Y44_00170 [Tenericutes bacterium GWF2_35_184]OHE43945.1 MAG: hypothetical protein A2221_10065 [Tenericutes bacterium RIFOXYA2_FULL_36_32]OHE46264.1 MAG: hypothetical protein A3K26_08855 [Tenericutes bacterium RIFOXYA1